MGAGALPEDIEAARDDASGQRLALGTAARARALQGAMHATREVLGEAAYARLLAEVSPSPGSVLNLAADEWIPLEHLAVWCEASLRDAGPAMVRPFVDRMMRDAFGRVRRVLLQIATPHGVLRRSSELWREDFSGGRLVAYATSPNTAIATLYEHRLLDSAVLRAMVAESFCYTLRLSGAIDATEEHGGDAGAPLLVRISWR